MRIRREVVGALCAILVTACAAQAAGPGDDGRADPSNTVDLVGELPEPLPTASGVAVEPTDPADTFVGSSSPSTSPATTTTAFSAAGNKVLLIGDSILASTAKRYSNDMCNALVPLGWQVAVEAEVSRGIAFGNEVLAKRKGAGWDVGVVFLGSNDGGNSPEYLKNLNRIITTFAPSPVVLITISEFKPEMIDINETIRAIAEVYPDRVSIIDWSTISRAPGVVNEDGIHLTTDGRKVLAEAVADHLGTAPTSPGECLPSTFHDDSAGSVTGGGKPNTTVKPGTPKPTATTVKPGGGSSTTVAGGSATTTGSGASTTVAGTTATTAAPPSSPPPSSAPATTATTAPPIGP